MLPIDALDWIGGRNPVCRNFLTGYGDAAHGSDLYSLYWFDLNHLPPGFICGNIGIEKYEPIREKPARTAKNAVVVVAAIAFSNVIYRHKEVFPHIPCQNG
jgi:hypothetical protein